MASLSVPSTRAARWIVVATLVGLVMAVGIWLTRTNRPIPLERRSILIPAQIPSRVPSPIDGARPATSSSEDVSTPTRSTGSTEMAEAASRPATPRRAEGRATGRPRGGTVVAAPESPETPTLEPVELSASIVGAAVAPLPSVPLMPSPAASAANAAVSRPPDMEAVLHALNQYAEALTNMDVSGARRIWPSVDYRALTGAFSTLEKNQMVLNACAVDVGARNTAFVTCQARVEFVPKVGNRSPQVASQQWRFTMNKIADQWKIQSATASADR